MELLAPAGNLECALAAFDAGADAVYCGLKRFNARERTENFSFDEMSRLIAYAHKLSRRVYVTFNTLVKEDELDEAAQELARLEELRPDAVIVQDLGVVRIAREYFPKLVLHGSTQMGLHNSAGLAVAKELGLDGIRSVSVLSPGVLGQTGIEASELIKAAAGTVKPAAVIVIDALAARSTKRLFTTVQICDTGISPGSGVQNKRKELSAATLSVPVIAVGVPTVVGAEIMAEELTDSESRPTDGLFVTPKDVDMLSDRISGILARALNAFLQPEIKPDILSQLV